MAIKAEDKGLVIKEEDEERVQLLSETVPSSSATSPWLKIHGSICCEMAIKGKD